MSEQKDFKALVIIGVFLLIFGLILYFVIDKKYEDWMSDEEIVTCYITDTYGVYDYDVSIYDEEDPNTITYVVFKDGQLFKLGYLDRDKYRTIYQN